MKKSYFIYAVLCFLFVSTACFSADKQTQKATNKTLYDRQYIVKVGDMAPDFLIRLPQGEKVKLSALRGKVVMLQFTASWCGVCRKEMPHIESEIWQKHKNNRDFALYGIDLKESADTIAMFAKETGVTYPIALDRQGRIFNLYAEKNAGVTRNVIIDREGKIVMLTRLYNEKEFAEMVALIDKLLLEKR